MLRNVFDSVDRNKALSKIDKNQHESNLLPMVVAYMIHMFVVKQTYMTSCCTYDMNEHEECGNGTSDFF